MASILGAAVTPFAATALVRAYGSVTPVGWYLVAIAVLTLIALLVMHETRDSDLHAVYVAP